MNEKILLKDQLFNREKIEYLAKIIKKEFIDFQDKKFIEEVLEKFKDLELKQRIRHISIILEKYLPKDFEKSLEIILKTLPEMPDLSKTDNDFGDFIFSPYGDFIARNGVKKEFLEISLNALEKLTSRFSMEDHIREFLNTFEEETYKKIIEWTKSENYHIRRLSSEGTRPKLPWAKKINLDYKKSQYILENLYNDKTRYVVRSVANHLNDISKIDPKFVIELLKKWKSNNKKSTNLDFIISHSLRSLVKKGDKETLEFLGFNNSFEYEINNFFIKNKDIKIGENLDFEFELTNKQDSNFDIIIDYKIYFLGKNGKLLKKVYKIKKTLIKSNETIKITKKHPLKIMTTRKLYFGEHFLDLQINGINSIKIPFFII